MFPLKVCNYKVGRTLGQGAYGKVKRKYHILTAFLTAFLRYSGHQ